MKLKRIFWLVILLVVIPPVWYLISLPDTRVLRTTNPSVTAIRSFRERQTREKGGTPQSRMEWRPLNQISSHVRHAVVLAEDDTFYQHHGFDFEQLKRAARTNWERKKFAYGASTITQQLARTLYLSSNKDLLRKLKEALITRRLEKSLSKDRILELYLNVVEWGPEIYGVEAAAQHFFNKSAAELTPDEAIALTAILPSPRKWSPLKQTMFMAQRRATLMDRMIRAKYLPPILPPEPEPSPSPFDEEEPAREETEEIRL